MVGVWVPRLRLAGPSSVTSIRAVLPVTDTDSRAVVRTWITALVTSSLASS